MTCVLGQRSSMTMIWTAALFGLGAFIEKAGTGVGSFARCRRRAARPSQTSLTTPPPPMRRQPDASKAWSALAAAATNTDTPQCSRSLAAAEVAAMLPETETRLVEALERASLITWRVDADVDH